MEHPRSRSKKVLSLIVRGAVCASAIYLISPVRSIPRGSEELAELMFSQVGDMEGRMWALAAQATDLEGEEAERFARARFMFQGTAAGIRAAIYRARTVSVLDRETAQWAHNKYLQHLEEWLEEARSAVR